MRKQKRLIKHLSIEDVKSENHVVLFGFMFEFRQSIYNDWYLHNNGYAGDKTYFNKIITREDDFKCAWFLRTQPDNVDCLILASSGSWNKLKEEFIDEYPSIKFKRNGNVYFYEKEDLLRAVNNSITFTNSMLVPKSNWITTHEMLLESDKENSVSNFIKSLIRKTCNVSDVDILVGIGRHEYSDYIFYVEIKSNSDLILTIQKDLNFDEVGLTMSVVDVKSKAIKMLMTSLMTCGLKSLSRETEIAVIETQKQFIL